MPDLLRDVTSDVEQQYIRKALKKLLEGKTSEPAAAGSGPIGDPGGPGNPGTHTGAAAQVTVTII